MNTAHASVEILAAYADGSLSEGMSLLIASHLTFCPACRATVAGLERVGGALLCEGEAVAPSDGCLAGALARLDAEAGDARAADPPADPDCLMPLPLSGRIGLASAEIRWRFLLPGLSEFRLDGFVGEEVKLLRARPGVRILQHTHTGEEATLILSGRMRDGDRLFCRGDLALADETDDHHPEIVGPETCICLVVLSGSMRLTGRLGRALRLFT